MKKTNGIVTFIIAFAILFFVPLIFFSLVFAKTGRHTQLLSKDYSLLGKSAIISRLNSDFPLPQDLVFHTPVRDISISTASFSAKLNQNQIVSDLLFRRLNRGLITYVKEFITPVKFSLSVNYDQSALDQVIKDLASQTEKPFVPTELELNQNSVIIKPGQIGSHLESNSLQTAINQALNNYDFTTITLPLSSVGSLPSADQVTQAQQQANRLVGKTLVLTTPDQSLTLDAATLIPWLGFSTQCQNDKINQYLTGLYDSLQKSPTDAVFKYDNGKVTEFIPSKDGYQLDQTNDQPFICQQMENLISGNNNSLTSDLPIITLKPKITTADVNNLGIKDLLGSGTSTFHHSNDTRNYNIDKGSSIINRILVAPGDTFSFIKNLGEVTVENGYKQAYIIRQGHTVLDAGGGICQVSTTLFRAMLNAGLNITERQPHAYRVSYYEEDSKPGFDATVFIPSPDLKFINDTGHYVLIQNTFDLKNRRLTYEIYGTSDGRQVEISNYHSWDSSPPPPDINIDDPTLPVGKTVQDEHAIPGLKTAFDWKVTRDGQIIHQKTFQSVYTPWAAVYRHGVAPTN